MMQNPENPYTGRKKSYRWTEIKAMVDLSSGIFQGGSCSEKELASIPRVYNGPRFSPRGLIAGYAKKDIASQNAGKAFAVCKQGHEKCPRALFELPRRRLYPAFERKGLLRVQC